MSDTAQEVVNLSEKISEFMEQFEPTYTVLLEALALTSVAYLIDLADYHEAEDDASVDSALKLFYNSMKDKAEFAKSHIKADKVQIIYE